MSRHAKRAAAGRIDRLPVRGRVAISAAAQMVSQLIVMLLAIVVLKIVTGKLGTHDYGAYATVVAFITTFSLLTDLGVNAITSREIAKNPAKAGEIISDNIAFRLTLSICAIPAISGIGFAFYPHGSPTLHWGIALLSLDLLFDSVGAVSLAYYSARVRSDVVAVATVVSQVLFLSFIAIALSLHWGVYGVIVSKLASDAIVTATAFILVRRRISIDFKIRLEHWAAIARISVPLGIIQVINMLYLKADSLLVSVIKGTVQVGFYGVAYSVVTSMLTVPSLIMTPLMPAMAVAKDLRPIVQKAYDVMIVLALPIACGALLLRRELVVAVSSPSYLAAATPLGILAVASVFSYLNRVFGFASVAADTHRKIVRVSVVSLIANIALNLAAIPRWGINGAATVTAITELGALWATYRIFRRETAVSVRLLEPAWKPLLASLTMVPLWYVAHPLWRTANSIVNLLIAVAILGAGYVVALVVLRGLPPEVGELVRKIRSSRKIPAAPADTA